MEEPSEVVVDEQVKVELYEPGEIPPYWNEFLRNAGIRILQHAVTFGLVIPEYTMRNYVEYAIESPAGYETLNIWGTQGAMKSCRSMIISHWIYDDWDTVLAEMVLVPDAKGLSGFEKRGFLQKMRGIQKGKCCPLLVWDDVTVGMPSATFKTDIEQYGAIDSAWAAIRTKIKVVVLNNPLIDRIGKNVKDNVTLEVFLGRNQVELIERFIRLPGLKHLESNFFKVQVEPLHKFNYRYVPRDVFKEYFSLRLEIAEFAIQKMSRIFKDEAALMEDMVTPFQIMAEVPIAPTSLNDLIKRNFIPHETVNGKIYVAKKDFEVFKTFFLERTNKRLGRVGVRKS